MSTRPPRPPAPDRPSPGRVLVAGLTLIGVLCLVAATMISVVVVSAGGRELASDSGYDRHSIALVLLAIAAVVLVVLALRTGSRTAALGIALVGLVALLLAILGDVPDLGKTGAYADLGLSATTHAGGGFYAETIGGALLLFCGAWLYVMGPQNANTPD